MKTSDFDYKLPQSYIAQKPAEPRDSARLMVADRSTGEITHRVFRDIGDYLQPGDLLVANESRVIPARLFARKAASGGKVELLLLSRQDDRTWEALVKGRRTPPGTELILEPAGSDARPASGPLAPGPRGKVLEWTEAGGRLIRWDQPIDDLLDDLGIVPLPPYIRTSIEDPERYQTVYARTRGSVAAPTAGLHFTPELILELRRRGIELEFVTLDIGLDTFRPVRAQNVEDHHIHTEQCILDAETARRINQAKLERRRVIAVGTTTVRVLETTAQPSHGCSSGRNAVCAWQTVLAFTGPTDLFIYPGFQFRVVDAMITNFHLPRSSLLMLVSAFAGQELVFRAYREAIRLRYRFFSFGDAMLIL